MTEAYIGINLTSPQQQKTPYRMRVCLYGLAWKCKKRRRKKSESLDNKNKLLWHVGEGLSSGTVKQKILFFFINILVYTSYHNHKAQATIFDKLNILCCSLCYTRNTACTTRDESWEGDGNLCKSQIFLLPLLGMKNFSVSCLLSHTRRRAME